MKNNIVFFLSLAMVLVCCNKNASLFVKSKFPKLIKRTELTGGHAATEYTWNGNTRTGDGSIVEYNDYGEVVRFIEANGHNYTFEYDECDNFCKRTKRIEEGTLGHRIETKYTWNGNIRTGDDGTITEYNDYGSIVISIEGQSIYTWEYMDCEDFCKMAKSSKKFQQDPKIETTYVWDGNIQIGDDGTVTEYNDLGNIMRLEFNNGSGYTYEYADCDECR
jgi:YD repeat-containing protein